MGQIFAPCFPNAAEQDDLELSNVVFGAVCSNNAEELNRLCEIERAGIVTLFGTSALADIQLAGGGAGAVFMCTFAVSKVPTTPGTFPALNTVRFTFFEAADFVTLNSLMGAYFTANPGRIMVCWSDSIAGNGAVFMRVIATIAGGG